MPRSPTERFPPTASPVLSRGWPTWQRRWPSRRRSTRPRIPSFDIERTIDAFDIRSGLIVEPDAHLVVIETVANIAVGASPWGPAAAGAETVPVFEGDALPEVDGQLVVIGKDNHRHAFARAAIDRLRAERDASSSSTWAGRPTTARTPTSPRSAPPGSSGAALLDADSGRTRVVRLGIDIGGTKTDAVAIDERAAR